MIMLNDSNKIDTSFIKEVELITIVTGTRLKGLNDSKSISLVRTRRKELKEPLFSLGAPQDGKT